MTQYFHEDFESTGYANRLSGSWVQGQYDQRTTSEARSGDQSLHVAIPQGSHYGMDAHTDLADAGVTNQPPRDLYASYWVKFASDFESDTNGGKLPGPRNRERTSGGGGGVASDGSNGWSALGKFASDGAGGVTIGYYCYHADMSGSWGDHLDGTSVSRGEWHHIEQRCKVNSVSGGTMNHDGVLTLWVDGERVYHNDSMRFTDDPARGVNWYMQVYYGGSDPSPADNDLWIDDWTLADERIGYPGPTTGNAVVGGDDGDGDGSGDSGGSSGDETDSGNDSAGDGSGTDDSANNGTGTDSGTDDSGTDDSDSGSDHTDGFADTPTMDWNHETRHGKQVAYADNFRIRNSVLRIDPEADQFNLVTAVEDPDGVGVIENCIIDGGGIFVHPTHHRGELWFKNCYILRSPNNGLYGDSPGAPDHATLPGLGGTVHVRGCLFEDNNISHARLNTGCSIKDTVIRNTGNVSICWSGQWSDGGVVNSRGLHTFYGAGNHGLGPVEAERIHVDITDANTNAPPSGPKSQSAFSVSTEGKQATNPMWNVTDSELRGSVYAEDRINRTNVGSNPRSEPPAGVPLQDADALNGSAAANPGWDESQHLDASGDSSGGTDGGGDDSDTGGAEPSGVVFTLSSASDAQNAAYSFAVDGDVTKQTSGDDAADANDELSEYGDGVVQVAGVAGNGYGDSYYVDGDVTELDYDPAQYTLYWDGNEVTRDDLLGADGDDSDSGSDGDGGSGSAERTVTFRSPSDASDGGHFVYHFVVDDVVDVANMEGHDRRVQDWRDGQTFVHGELYAGGHEDTYTISGDVSAFDAPDAVTIEVDGEPVDSL